MTPRTFDVICAGEALWKIAQGDVSPLRFRPGGGAVNAAVTLARYGLRVGLATILDDDSLGRALAAKIAASGVDVGGVELATTSHGLVLVEGGARQIVSFREEEQPVSIPESWSSQVLLLSGMSPVLSHAAALCRAARAARRRGSAVVVDINTRWHLWKGRDPRAIHMILREADVVWCSAEDLFGLNMDVATMRAALRANAVLVSSNGAGTASANGPFGEIVLPNASARRPADEGNAFAAAICMELARAGMPAEGHDELWSRALERGRSATIARR